MNNSDLVKIKEIIKNQLENENNNIKDFYIILVDALDENPNLTLEDYKEIILYIKSFNLDDYANYAKLFKKLLLIKIPKIKEFEKNIIIAKEKRNIVNEIDEIYNNINKDILNKKNIKKINKIYKNTKEKILLLDIDKTSLSIYVDKFKNKINKILNKTKINKNILISILSVFIIGIIIGFSLIGSIPKLSYMTVKDYNKQNPDNKSSFIYGDNEIICTGIKGLIFPFHFPIDEIEVSNKYKASDVFGIAPKAFKDSNIKSVILPNDLLYIGDEAFMNCRSLVNVYSKIDANLYSYQLPNLYKIGKKSFYGCVNLFELTLPGNIKNIGKDAFSLCGSNFTLNYESSSRNWRTIYSYDYDFILICLSYSITIIGVYDYDIVIDVVNNDKYSLGSLPKKDGYEAFGYLYNEQLIAYADGIAFDIFDYNKDIIVHAIYNKIGG